MFMYLCEWAPVMTLRAMDKLTVCRVVVYGHKPR